MNLLTTTVLLLMAGGMHRAQAQAVVVHTNVALWAAEAANLGIDFTINDYMTVGGTAIVSMDDSWVKDVNLNGLQLDLRFWPTRRVLQSFFVGPQLGLYHYRMDEPASTPRHTALTAGLEFGYGWMLSRHWNLDLSYGAGYLFWADPSAHNRFTMTSLGINLSYVF